VFSAFTILISGIRAQENVLAVEKSVVRERKAWTGDWCAWTEQGEGACNRSTRGSFGTGSSVGLHQR
jgi:hypothetical protein